MSTTTTNFGWTVPSDTDLVKDGAAAIRTALGGVDTSFVDLKGGTSGQILSKASGTDLDYTWIDQNTGDITGVTAGTGISGGGTSGTVTVTNSMATAIDAKGDLIAGTGSDAFARLAVGTNGYVLTADSAETTGMKWAAAAGGGKVLQVVQATYATPVTTTSGSYVTSGLTVSITPSASTSKILVMYTMNNQTSRSGTYSDYQIALYRNSTSVIDFGNTNWGDGGGFVYAMNFDSGMYLDSPSTTSSTSYTVYGKRTVGTLVMNNGTSSIIAMEIGA